MKFILIILVSISFLLGGGIDSNNSNTSEIILSKKLKETNTTKYEEVLFIRKFLVNNYNQLMPDFLQVEPKEDFGHLSIGYDLLHKEVNVKLKVRVLLPYFKKTITKTSSLKTSGGSYTKTQSYEFKIAPYLRIYKTLPSVVIKPSFTYKRTLSTLSLISREFAFNEAIYYYLPANEAKEITSLQMKRFLSISNLSFKAEKTIYSYELDNIYYNFGTYLYDTEQKLIRIYGLTLSGERKKEPFIYSYKLFFTGRHTLFDKKYLYVEFTPYYLFSKEWNYKPKFFAFISLNFKF